ncbi:unnamed protein product [Symbiodinium sp. CCMP2592]|nr:unnamed protein product [Symbiodinium sp. CCMP2592]
MPLDELMACRKTRIFSRTGHVHSRKLLTPECQIHVEQGKRLMNKAKTAAMTGRPTALKLTGLPTLTHYASLRDKADDIEMNRRGREKAAAAAAEAADADMFAAFGDAGEGGEAPAEQCRPREAPTLDLCQLGEEPQKKKPKPAKKAPSRHSSQNDTGKPATIVNMTPEDEQHLKETDPEMHMVVQALQTCHDCLLKLSVASVLEGGSIGNSIWSAREKVLVKLQGTREYDILSRRLLECEAASKLMQKGGVLKLQKADLQQVLVVLNDMDNLRLPMSLRLQLMERRGYDLLEEVLNSSDESKWKARANDFAATIFPLVTENEGFDLFRVTCSCLVQDEKVRKDTLSWLGDKAESGEELVYKDGFEPAACPSRCPISFFVVLFLLLGACRSLTRDCIMLWQARVVAAACVAGR